MELEHDQLCDICRQMCDETTWFGAESTDGDKHIVYAHQSSLRKLKLSADDGCSLCDFLFEDLIDQYDLEKSEYADVQAPDPSKRFIIHPELVIRPNDEDLLREESYRQNSCAATRYSSSVDSEGRVHNKIITVPRPERYPAGTVFISRRVEDPFRVLTLVSFGRVVDETNPRHLEKRIEVFTSEDDPLARILLNRPLLKDYLSTSSINNIQNWLETCSVKHESCSSWTHSRKLPTRLIDVGESRGNSSAKLKYTEGSTGIYAALSYCWGTKSQNYITTKDNLTQMMQEISIEQMPATLYDSLLLCREIGIQYIWIDALCIIQDDEEDWAIQAAKMASVYGNAALTFAIDKASELSDGFMRFEEPRPRPCLPWKESASQIEGLLYVRTHHDDSGWKDGVLQGPLGRRAWTLQERLLSPRILHFGFKLYWECQHHVLSEDERVMAHNKNAEKPSNARLTVTPQLQEYMDPNSPTDTQSQSLSTEYFGSSMYVWAGIVEEYSRRKISNPLDKLPAIAGLAENFKVKFGGKYFAGLWNTSFSYNLLWNRRSSYLEKSPKYRAPSWSWAALDGDIEFWEPEHIIGNRTDRDPVKFEELPEIGVVDIFTPDSVRSRHTNIPRGHVSVWGPLKEAVKSEKQSFDVPTVKAVQLIGRRSEVRFMETKDQHRENVWTCIFDENIEFEKLPIFFLRVHTSATIAENRLQVMKYGCLILTRENEANTYSRLGVASLTIRGQVFHENLGTHGGHLAKLWDDLCGPWERETVRII